MPSGVAALGAMGLWPFPPGVSHRALQGWAVVLESRPFFVAAEPLGGDQGCWLVDQGSLLAHLLEQLRHHSDTRLLEASPVRSLLRAGGSMGRVVGVVLADGKEVKADLVVGCDGRHSLLRQQAGLELKLEPPGEEVLWFRLAGTQVAPLVEWLGGRFLTVVAGGLSFALFVEAAGEGLRLGWVSEAGVAQPTEPVAWRERWCQALPAEAAALLAQVPMAAIRGPQRLPVRVGWAPLWHVPGLLLLGDAAHPMSPVRAQGINMALRDALVAAQLLATPIQGAGGRAGWAVEQSRGFQGPIDALLPCIAERRLPEILLMQRLQGSEAKLGAHLRQWGGLRWALARGAPWSGMVARARWIQQQHRLRQGLPGALSLPEWKP